MPEFLADLVPSYPFEKSKTPLNQTNFHAIYWDDGLVLFKVKNRVQYIEDCLVGFNQTVGKASGNQHL